jgi:serine protease Do
VKNLTPIAFVIALVLAATPALPHRGGATVPVEQTRSSPTLLNAFAPAVQPASRSTVRIRGDGHDIALGTVVRRDGLIVTKASELTGPDIRVVLHDGRHLVAHVVGVSREHDLALLRVGATDLAAIAWADEGDGAVGSWVASCGMGPTPLAVGVVSVARRAIPSGGGLLGVYLEQVEGGLRIVSVADGSSAERAGLLAEDVIVAIDDEPITTRELFTRGLRQRGAGAQVGLTIRRGHEQLSLTALLAARAIGSNPRSDFQNRLGGPLSIRNAGFPSVIQHDTVLRPSDCGGPVVTVEGKALGINIARAGRTETYALPADVVIQVVEQLLDEAQREG